MVKISHLVTYSVYLFKVIPVKLQDQIKLGYFLFCKPDLLSLIINILIKTFVKVKPFLASKAYLSQNALSAIIPLVTVQVQCRLLCYSHSAS